MHAHTTDEVDVPLLSISHLTMAFTSTLALNDVDFHLHRGEIHALLGQNGAGKSTLIKILAGVHRPLAGEIRLAGRHVEPATQKLPINFIHQDLGLVDAMSVAENVAIAAGYARRGGLIDWRAAERSAREALSLMESDIDPALDVGSLTSAEKSIVAIARALATKCEILVLDEPTAALPEADVEHLFAALDRLRARGLGIIYVTHRLDEVFRLADRVTVLRDGARVATAPVGEINSDHLVAMIVGRNVVTTDISAVERGAEPLLEARDVVCDGVGPVSFSLMPGETLALVGLRGAGHTRIARALFGDRRVKSGSVRLGGQFIDIHSPEDAMAMGIGLISSKRGEESTASALNVRENLFLNPVLTGTSPFGWLAASQERVRASAVVERYAIRPGDTERPVSTLSGGNQQKVVVARWLEGRVRLLILEEPTAGVDVGSKAEIYSLMQRSLARGMGVLLVSTDFEEVARVAHRAVVFDRGRIAADVPRDELTVAHLTALASGTPAMEQIA
ncbi:MAG TPA: sugar ABC transporter ATP-binding protein [Bauldia sp.]|nr:sugar ABC transporter ATP-binding protein [Bauldia sp.]